MTVQELKAALDERRPGIYFLAGEEEYLKTYWLKKIRESILTEPDFNAFNYLRLEGEKLDLPALAESVSTPPILAEQKLVEVHLCPVSAFKEKELSALADLAAKIRDDGFCVLVFYVQPEDLDVGVLPKKPSKMYTLLSKFSNIVFFSRGTDAQLVSWIQKHFAAAGIKTLPAVAQALLDRSGHDMESLSGEIEKLICYIHSQGREELTPADVANVASSTVESDAFTLSNAILEKNGSLAFRALTDMKQRKLEPTYVLTAISSVYADLLRVARLSEEGLPKAEIAKLLKMHEYRTGLYLQCVKKTSPEILARVTDACRRADVQSKSGGQTGYGVLERLIAEALSV